jgi:hypothetical protein
MHPSYLRSQSDCSKLKAVHVPAFNHPQETIYSRECSKKSHGKNYAPYQIRWRCSFCNLWKVWRMRTDSRTNRGIKSLVRLYKNIFRSPENLNHYSKRDYRKAERKFLKYALEQRRIDNAEELFER